MLENAAPEEPCYALRRFEIRAAPEGDIHDPVVGFESGFFNAYPNLEMVHVETNAEIRDCLALYRGLANLRTANLYVDITVQVRISGVFRLGYEGMAGLTWLMQQVSIRWITGGFIGQDYPKPGHR